MPNSLNIYKGIFLQVIAARLYFYEENINAGTMKKSQGQRIGLLKEEKKKVVKIT